MKTFTLLFLILLLGCGATAQQSKKENKSAAATFNGMKIEQASDAPAGILKDTTGAVYIQLTLKVAPVQMENATGEVFFTEQNSALKGNGLIPFSNLSAQEIEAVIAQIKYLQAKKKL